MLFCVGVGGWGLSMTRSTEEDENDNDHSRAVHTSHEFSFDSNCTKELLLKCVTIRPLNSGQFHFEFHFVAGVDGP